MDEARDAVARAKSIVPTWTLALFENGTRIAWRDRPEIVEPQHAGLRTLGIE